MISCVASAFERNIMRFWILALVCCLFCVQSRASEWRLRSARVFSSEDGDRAIKIIPIQEGEDKEKANAILFNLNPDGSENKVAEWKLVNRPQQVLVPNSTIGFVVTLENYDWADSRHTLVIYDDKGQMLHELTLEDLFSKREISEHVRRFRNARGWRGEATFSFEIPTTRIQTPKLNDEKLDMWRNPTTVISHPEKARLNINFKWGKKISIELATGKIENLS